MGDKADGSEVSSRSQQLPTMARRRTLVHPTHVAVDQSFEVPETRNLQDNLTLASS